MEAVTQSEPMGGKSDSAATETAAVAGASMGASVSISSITSSTADDEGRFVAGTLLGGRYRVLGLLGRGGMGEVYRATDLMLGQSVALKFLPEEAAKNPRLLERFHGEVRVARMVSHPNVCRVFDIGQIDGAPYISMEYVDGEDLASLLLRIGRLPADKAVEIARKLCAGLAAAHERGVIHRDLKPQNIMINKRGEVVIMDFGLAAIAAQLSGAEARSGTPAYMAPEQLKGAAVTARSDIYSLGLVLYELFTGKRPFEAATLQQLIDRQESAHWTSISSIASDVDPAVEKVIRRCLAPDPDQRPAGALAISAALPGGDALAMALAAGETPSPEVVAAAGKLEGLARRYSIPALLAVAACLFVAPVIRQQTCAVMHARLDYPPDVLAQKSREMAAAFGYPERPADSVVSIQTRSSLVSYLRSLPPPRKWDEWLVSEAPIASEYREAAAPMFASPYGIVSWDNPPPTSPGMVNVKLDGYGRLLEFSAIPRRADTDMKTPVTPDAVFRAAGLDMSKFSATTPSMVPAAPSDSIQAWKGPHPVIPATDVTVQMASWKGRITSARVDYYRSGADSRGSNGSPVIRVVVMVQYAMLATAAIFILLMARRNWKSGRVDRTGALRIGMARFAFGALFWVGWTHLVTNVMSAFLAMVGSCLLAATMIWLVYLALEPEVRARWPHSIVTWNRVLAGRWLDAQVGSHILIGAMVGAATWTVFKIVAALAGPQGALSTETNIGVAMGAREWIWAQTSAMNSAIDLGLIIFLTIFAMRVLLRKDVFAALAVAFLLTFTENEALSGPNWLLMFAMYFAVYGILAFVLLRFGLASTLSAVFFIKAIDDMTLGTDWTTWYAPSGIATLVLLLGIAVFAFWRSLGGRELLEARDAA